jgi:hypothetical protein
MNTETDQHKTANPIADVIAYSGGVVVNDLVTARIAAHDGFSIEETPPGVWLVGGTYQAAQRRAALASAVVWPTGTPLPNGRGTKSVNRRHLPAKFR